VRNLKVVVSYDGTDYFGFQYQPEAPTIQAELERVLSRIVKEPVTVYGSGRTDAGVHAAGQVINFRTEGTVPIDRLCLAMNSLLPESIAALEASEVDNSFHARYCAVSRTYEYSILNREVPDALRARFSWHIRHLLDVDSMQQAAKALIGRHDFSSFASADRDATNPIRDLQRIEVEREQDSVKITVQANAFLRSMVRVIVGTLTEVGLGLRAGCDMKNILEAADRRQAGKTAPARGLCLREVEYIRGYDGYIFR
jgi:tRNA pseudouridine38-40 synthase